MSLCAFSPLPGTPFPLLHVSGSCASCTASLPAVTLSGRPPLPPISARPRKSALAIVCRVFWPCLCESRCHISCPMAGRSPLHPGVPSTCSAPGTWQTLQRQRRRKSESLMIIVSLIVSLIIIINNNSSTYVLIVLSAMS